MPINSGTFQGFKEYAAKEAVKSALSSRFPDIKQGLNLPTWAAGMTTGINAGQNLMSPGAYNYASNELRSVKGQSNLSLLEGAKRIAATEAANRLVDDALKGNFRKNLTKNDTGTGQASAPMPAQQLAPLTGPTRIVLGTRDGVTPDWSQSDQYKAELAQYANTIAGPSKEALGMQIWAQAHPELAAKVQPGQAGYDVIQKQGVRQPGQPEGVVSMPWSMQKPVLGATNAWNPEQQQPDQIAQPEMGEDRTGSTNERVQAFLDMLTGVGQGR